MSIKFTKQEDGSFKESGDFLVGTRTVRLYVDGTSRIGVLRSAKEYLKTMRDMLGSGTCPAQEYELREMEVTPPNIIAQRVAQLVKARAVKKAMRAS